MSKARHLRARGQQAQGAPSTAAMATAPAAAGIEAFSFGDPTPVLEHADILDCFECWKNGHWYAALLAQPLLCTTDTFWAVPAT
ncbi:hypothetical protein [Janthinobacterium sp. RT4P48]|uniref:hypothetical protein n=1 Tax=Janthinobacterium sp. RT4P48 TaxID=3424188 RepID=UPI003F234DA4